MDNNFRTDLATELVGNKKSLPAGVTLTEKYSGNFNLEKMFVDKEGEIAIGKPLGTYITINCGSLADLDHSEQEVLVNLIADEIHDLAFELTGKKADGNFKILVVGLGNINMTPDAIGPKCVSMIGITRKLAEEYPKLFGKLKCSSISAVSPGTSGQTGIETLELVKNAVNCVAPDLVVAIDALAARSSERLGTTVQISSSGIHPGSGVGNRRKGINSDTIGVPVMALGIPTVVDSATIIKDVILKLDASQVHEALEPFIGEHKSFLVSLGNCDTVVDNSSKILASAIDTAFGINSSTCE